MLGPKRLPELARALGKSMREFREAMNGGVIDRGAAGQRAASRPEAAHARSAASRSAVRLIVARCEISYVGRLTTVLPEAVRLLMLKADGTFMVWADGGGPT